MQIVINIDEEVYKRTLPYKDLPIISNLANDYDEITHAVANGVTLPKGHGDLKDISKIDYQSGCFISSEGEPIPIIHKIATIEMIRDWLPTIIEADKAESENP